MSNTSGVEFDEVELNFIFNCIVCQSGIKDARSSCQNIRSSHCMYVVVVIDFTLMNASLSLDDIEESHVQEIFVSVVDASKLSYIRFVLLQDIVPTHAVISVDITS